VQKTAGERLEYESAKITSRKESRKATKGRKVRGVGRKWPRDKYLHGDQGVGVGLDG